LQATQPRGPVPSRFQGGTNSRPSLTAKEPESTYKVFRAIRCSTNKFGYVPELHSSQNGVLPTYFPHAFLCYNNG